MWLIILLSWRLRLMADVVSYFINHTFITQRRLRAARPKLFHIIRLRIYAHNLPCFNQINHLSLISSKIHLFIKWKRINKQNNTWHKSNRKQFILYSKDSHLSNYCPFEKPTARKTQLLRTRWEVKALTRRWLRTRGRIIPIVIKSLWEYFLQLLVRVGSKFSSPSWVQSAR